MATVGRLEARPNLINVVPQLVRFTVDLRNTEEPVLARAEVALVRVGGGVVAERLPVERARSPGSSRSSSTRR